MIEIVAETQTGKVRGSMQKETDNHEFYAFKGIPYAKPPVGPLRFRDPVPVELWSGIREATKYSPQCTQFDLLDRQLKGEEDCLYLNVFTKDMKYKAGRPVLVWIHPGFFLCGSGDDHFYGPDYFMRKDVVFVTLNYRLGIFGFLNLNDEEASGNQGLKDQVMALEWIQNNIANFGGDPSNVTIFGTSAGSASAHYLAISPLAKRLFHKVILQSGVVLNPWAFNSEIKERTHQLCEFLGYSEKNSKSVLEFLRSLDAQQLVIAQEKMLSREDSIWYKHSFGPSIDCKSNRPFMPVHPESAAAEGIQIPLIIGHTSREGNFHRKDLTNAIRFVERFDETLSPDIVDMMKKWYNLTPEDLKHIYFKSNSTEEENLETLIDFYGDIYYTLGIHRVLKGQVKKSRSPTYFYQFSHTKTYSKPGQIKSSGAGHAREIVYLFKMKHHLDRLGNVEKGDSEKRRISEQMIELWVNFATTGNPTHKTSHSIPLCWKPVDSKTDFHRLDIGESLRMDTVQNLEQRFILREN